MQLERFEEYGHTFIAPREYCTELKVSDNNTHFLLDFNEFIGSDAPKACNVSLVNRLFLDAGLTAELVKLWKEQTLDGIMARFVATDGSRESGYESGILVSKAVDLNLHQVELKPAVVGVKLNVTAWMNTFINATLKVNHVDCVILDDGGFLLMSNQEDYITQFFGEIDPVLMINLVNTSLYSFNKTYDYQSVCDPEKDSKAAAGHRTVYVPTIADLLSVGWWASTAACRAHGRRGAGRHVQGELHHGADPVLLPQRREVLRRGAGLRELLQAEQPSEGPDLCELAQNPRYRKGPDVCFDNDDEEDDSDCGAGTSLRSSSLWSMLGLQLLLLWPTTTSTHS
ncbi:hypothetical protein NHX12_003465 [Muraenolepis orangiensis]|uniref:Voltage-dependent calcium channel alpha-2/delta subunit conserved region domain-containing protein n=1 Tax=Muraenolepis orangiensis TaxID=630683 RepID=A0A9Q0E1F9_9TELE|nr:hypothetical protein NHX12_003465 [Muraenolepis orangiensis]